MKRFGLLIICSFAMSCANATGGGQDLDPDARPGGGDARPGSSDAPGSNADAMPGTGPVTCGNTTCRNDQSCVSNECRFTCEGTKVPGDYATIQGAVNALAGVDSDATICLTAPTYSAGGLIRIAHTNAHANHLSIIGLGMDTTRIQSRIEIGVGWNKVSLRGLQVDAGNDEGVYIDGYNQAPDTYLKVDLVGVKTAARRGVYAVGRVNLLVDGCDARGMDGQAIDFYNPTSTPLIARVENSYLHDSQYGVRSYQGGGLVDLRMTNNLVADVNYGVMASQYNKAVLVNNMFTGARIEGIHWDTGGTVTSHHNALWNNTAHYGGAAVEGANTIKADCLLDQSSRIPTLKPGSPCRNAGSAAEAPAHDFWFSARSAASAPDLGPVEVN
jgi:hypothetical protein